MLKPLHNTIKDEAIDMNDILEPWESSRNYRSVVCKTMKWSNIIKMEELKWCIICICLCVFGFLSRLFEE
jgi:hypothetical protein